MIIPRQYQVEAVDALFEYFMQNGGNPLVALPTATGKSVVIALFCYRAVNLYPRTRIGIFTHVKELIEQNYNKLMEAWPQAPAGIFSAGLKRKDANKQILFGGIQSVANVIDELGWFDLIIVDEAHLVSPEDETRYMKVIDAIKRRNPNLKVWGTTATWWRKKQGALTNEGIFTDICYDRTKPEDFQRFIAEGFLSPLIARATQTKLDVSEVATVNGDYNAKQLEAAVDHNSITQSALREVCYAGEGRRAWLMFCSGIAHAEHVAEMLNSWGIRTGVVHSKVKNRDEIIAAWKRGEYRCVTNNNVLTTGIDYPAIDLIGMLRPTRSSSLWVQMLGRGMRVSPRTLKRDCLVLDFAGNTMRLGPVDDPEIPGRPRPGPPGDAPVKQCPQCQTYNAMSVRFCSYCAYEFPRSENIVAQSSSAPLMSSDLPVYETFTVDSCTYDDYYSKTDNRSIKVSYHCGIRTFAEYVSIGGTGFPLHKAKNWWMQRSNVEPPETIEDALDVVSSLRVPTRIRVWLSTKYPTIVEHEWH